MSGRVIGTAGPILMLEVSLGSSWPKDSPRMEASGFPEPAGPEIRKNQKKVFDKYFLCPKKLSGYDGYYNLNIRFLFLCVKILTPLSTLHIRVTSNCRSNFICFDRMFFASKLSQ